MSPILGSMGKDKDIENFRNIIDGYKIKGTVICAFLN